VRTDEKVLTGQNLFAGEGRRAYTNWRHLFSASVSWRRWR